MEQSVQAYVTNLNTTRLIPFRKSRLQLRKADQEGMASTMIHKLKGYSTKGSSYNNHLFAMYQDNQRNTAAQCNVLIRHARRVAWHFSFALTS